MIKKRSPNTDGILAMVRESLQDLSGVKDVTLSIRQLDTLQCPSSRHYGARDVQRIRRKLHVSQAILAHLLNTKLTTIQKWERGVNEPNGPASRLLQLLEQKGLAAFRM